MKRKTALAAFLVLLFLSAGLWSQASAPETLYDAVAGGDIAKARTAITAGASANALVPSTGRYAHFSETLLMEAALRGKPDMVALLLESGAKTDTADSRGMTALSYAVSLPAGAEAARLLAEKGARADAPVFDDGGRKMSILKAAAINGMLPVIDILAPGAGEAGKKDLSEAMRWVGAQGKVDLVEALLSRGVAPLWDDLDRSDSLVRAAQSGYLDVIIALMKRGARADSPDADATTPLMAASAYGRLEVLRYLLEKGAKVFAMDRKGRTALSYVRSYYSNNLSDPSIPPPANNASSDRIAAMSDLLSKAGAPFDLFYAIRAGDLVSVKKLCTAGNANSRDLQDPNLGIYQSDSLVGLSSEQPLGPSPLYLAVSSGRLDIAKVLAEKGALVDDPSFFRGKYDSYAMSPLGLAVDALNEAMVAFLLGKGARPSDEMLADACERQALGIVKLLVEKGANVNALWPGEIYGNQDYGDEGWSRVGDVLSVAVQAGASPVVDFLRKKGAKLSRYVLAAALTQGNEALAKDCLASGIKADANELVLACQLGNVSIAQILLKAGVAANGTDASGRTPLTAAAEKMNFALVKLLVENGADVAKTSGKEGETAFDIVNRKTGKEAGEIADFLRLIPPGPGAYRIRKELSQAVLKKDAAALKKLLDAKADPRMRYLPPDGSELSLDPPSLLDFACVTESKETMQLLMARGAGLDDVDKGLSYLAAAGRLDLVELILSSKTKEPEYFKTRLNELLCIAGRTDDARLASLALAKGADPNIEIYGNPLREAAEHDSMTVAALLAERGATAGSTMGLPPEAAYRLYERFLFSGKLDAAKRLVSGGLSASGMPGSGRPLLCVAIRLGDKAAFDWLLANGADPGMAEKSGDTPLHAAVDSGEPAFAQALIEKRAPLDARDILGETAAMRAASLPGRQAFLTLFLKRGMAAGLPAGKGPTLIDAVMACGAWNGETADLLSASYAASPAADPALDARQRFFLALMRRDLGTAAALLQDGAAKANQIVFIGKTALMGCAAAAYPEGMKLLLEKGADPALRDAGGLSALSLAARSGNRAAVDLLIAALPKSPDPREEALRQAAYSGDAGQVKAYIDAGVDPDAAEAGGTSALYLAAWQGRKETVDLLLKAAAAAGRTIDLDRRCRSFERAAFRDALTAAEAALANGFPDLASLLMDKGARVDWMKASIQARTGARAALFRLFASRAGAEEKRTAGVDLLESAALYSDAQAVKLILAAGVDATQAFNSLLAREFSWKDAEEILALIGAKISPERAYTNVLEIAVRAGKAKLVKALLDAGMDPNVPVAGTWWEESPTLYRLAAFDEYPAIMRLLLAKGAKEPLSPPESAFLRVYPK
jgi:ankyrin repeat protein